MKINLLSITGQNGRSSAILLLLLCFTLSACAFNQIDAGLNAIQGQNIQYAIDRLGYPAGKREILDKTVYVWGTSHDVTSITPVTTYSNGSAFGSYGTSAIYSGTSTAYIPTTTNYNCTIEMITNKSNIIVSAQWKGNLGGCSYYGPTMQKIADSLEALSMANIGPEPETSDLILCQTTDEDGPYEWKTARTACADEGGIVIKVLDP